MTEAPTLDRALSAKEVCDVAGISKGTFHRLAREDRDFVTYKSGRHRKMRYSQLLAWMRKQEEKEAVA